MFQEDGGHQAGARKQGPCRWTRSIGYTAILGDPFVGAQCTAHRSFNVPPGQGNHGNCEPHNYVLGRSIAAAPHCDANSYKLMHGVVGLCVVGCGQSINQMKEKQRIQEERRKEVEARSYECVALCLRVCSCFCCCPLPACNPACYFIAWRSRLPA